MKILICTPFAQQQCHHDYLLSMLTETFMHTDRLENQNHYQIALQTAKGYSGLGKDRGMLASYAVNNGFDKVMFVDSDQAWTWSDFKTLVDSNVPIIGGVIPLKQYPIVLNFKTLERDRHFFNGQEKTNLTGLTAMVNAYRKIQTTKKEGPAEIAESAENSERPIPPKSDGPKPIDFFSGESAESIEAQSLINLDYNIELPVLGVGTGFLCIDVGVLEMMKKNCPSFVEKKAGPNGGTIETTYWDYFQSGVVNGIYYGEDWGFCLKARELGIPSFINPSVRPKHIGNHDFFADSTRI